MSAPPPPMSSAPRPTASVVIAAHDEEHVIGRCLRALLTGATPGELEITVVANGCTDRTAQVAAGHPGVRVVEIREANKSRALNVGDRATTAFPRVYLDADLEASPDMVRELCRALRQAPSDETRTPEQVTDDGALPLAVAPRRAVDTRGRPWPVRAYYAVNTRLPTFEGSLFGRGMFALSEQGRARFGEFPDLVSDDMFVDAQFARHEKRQVDSVVMVVPAPLRTRDLTRRLVRVWSGARQLRDAAGTGEVTGEVRGSDRWAWLRDVVVPEPRLVPAGIVYVLLTLGAGALARVRAGQVWERDESTRAAGAAAGSR
ncbi:glycosyl transferase family 2 [Georgenia soli]|uniref:Glycosyl transferase family 2 n=1 Tax=Georgenia soli TaxID=638953 RepID=A0A2A9EJ60_9MICO|nr:glycosyltransferase family 2 protein [Georgenia soli]PFG38853.1 glycosyl transferase family 2 [Georgenia soli]